LPAEVKMFKSDLLGILRQNRDAHQRQFLDAEAKRRERVITVLTERLADIRDGGDIDLVFRLPSLEDHTADYDREIEMLGMEIEDTVVLSAQLFEQLVRDRWGWSATFASTSSAYLTP
jgi:hypothetical protein